MELETIRLYREELDEYGHATDVFDGYFITHYADGYVGDDAHEIKSETLGDSESRKLFSTYLSFKKKYEGYIKSNWKNGRMEYAKKHMEDRISELELIVNAIRELDNE